MKTSVLAALVLSFSLASTAAAIDFAPVESQDQKVLRRWRISGDPRGVALGADGTIYVGLAGSQAVAAIDPKSGTVRKSVVLDSADIAATKELVALRTNAKRDRLLIANGSDESVSILSLPGLAVVREITLEGEAVRDIAPDPAGRYIYVLGRRLHVYDSTGQTELKTIDIEDPMALAVSSTGAHFALVAKQPGGPATILYDAASLKEVGRASLPQDSKVQSALFAAGDAAIVTLTPDALIEQHLEKRDRSPLRFNSSTIRDRICLPPGSGPQIATLSANSSVALVAERRCDASATFANSDRAVTPASLYGVDAYALAFDRADNTLVTTERAGYVTIYRVPRVAIAK